VLRFITEELPRRHGIHPGFDIVCGTSVGAIHACFLAATAEGGTERGQRLADIWEDLRVDEVFRVKGGSWLKLPARIWGLRNVGAQLRAGHRPDRLYGFLDTGPLERLVMNAIPWRGIRRNLREGRLEAVCVTATQIATGRAVVFTERKDRELPPWASRDALFMQSIRLMPIHALASAAIPVLFPAVRVGARYYADGGLRLNTPLAPAVRLGANRILVIGLSHQAAEVTEAHAQERAAGFGNPMFLLGKVLNALLLSPIETDLARMQLVNSVIDNGERAFGSDFLERLNAAGETRSKRPLQRIDTVAIRPTYDLGLLAGELLQGRHGPFEVSGFLNLLFRTFRSSPDPREADLLSYLLFDFRYARLLTDLGYRDAEAREDELAAFFGDEPMA
jgi:NTE family protein